MSTRIPIISSDESKLPSLLNFFRHKEHFEILLEFIANVNKSNTKLSLNLLEWLVINYSKHHGVIYSIFKNGKAKSIFLWIEYEAALDGNNKKSFDFFQRNPRDKKKKKIKKTINLEYGESKYLKTSVAQLNFFRWAIKNGVIDYLKKHLDEIYNDMKKRGKKHKKKTKKPLSISVSKTLGVHKVRLKVTLKKKEEKNLKKK